VALVSAGVPAILAARLRITEALARLELLHALIRQFFALLIMSLGGNSAASGLAGADIILAWRAPSACWFPCLSNGRRGATAGAGQWRADGVVLTSVGARVFQSSVAREEAAVFRDMPGIRRGPTASRSLPLNVLSDGGARR